MIEHSEGSAVPLIAGEIQNYQSKGDLSIQKQAAKGLFWSAAQKYGERAISFAVLLILARLLSPTAFGLVALATVFISFSQIFMDQGFSDAIIQAPRIDQALLNTAFWANFVTSSLIVLISATLSEAIADFYHESQLASIIRWLSLSFFLSALSSVQQALLRRRFSFRSLAIRSFIATLCGGILAIGMAILGGEVWSLVARMVASAFFGAVILWGISDWRPSFSFSMASFKTLYSYGINIVGANFATFFNRHADDMLIGFFLGATMLGYYSLAYGLLLTATEMLVSVPNAVAFPAFSRIWHDASLMQKSIYEVTQIISIITMPFFVCAAILAPEIVNALYGPQWIKSVPVVRVLMPIGIVHSAIYFFGSMLNAVGKPGWRFAILSITAFLNVIGFAISVRWGIVAVAASYVCVGYFIAPFYLYLLRRTINLSIRTYLRQYVPAIMGTLVMSMAVLVARNALYGLLELHLRLGALIVLAMLCYCLSIFLFARPVLYRMLRILADMLPQASPCLNLILKNQSR